MRIKRKDLELLRKLEVGLDLTRDIPDQINDYVDKDVIEKFGMRFFLPPFIGGKWYFVLARMSGVNKDLVDKLEFPVEVGFNLSVPKNLLPEVTVSFYTQDLKQEDEILKNSKPEYFETSVLAEYDFPISFPLSQDEVKIIEILLNTPTSGVKEIATELNLPAATIKAKLSRLQLDQNKKGIFTIVPTINWTKIRNFTHLHIGIESGLSHEMINERLKKLKLIGAGWYRGTIYQLEFDLWEPYELCDILDQLAEITDLKAVGFLFARKSIVIDHWVQKIIK